MNDPGFEVPDNHILVIPHSLDIPEHGYYNEIITPLAGKVKRDWFTDHFYYCLPLNIGNQYGFVINSLIDFEAYWPGGEAGAQIKILNDDNKGKQIIEDVFHSGIITVQNMFALKTPPGINLMTIQPPNMFIPTCVAMTGVIETDNIRRDFTFNIKMTLKQHTVKVKKGDPLGAFIPIPRNYVENFNVVPAVDIFDKDIVQMDVNESQMLGRERRTRDREKPHGAGRRYFKGYHTNDTQFNNHQKKNNIRSNT